jgi:hypothetical protein
MKHKPGPCGKGCCENLTRWSFRQVVSFSQRHQHNSVASNEGSPYVSTTSIGRAFKPAGHKLTPVVDDLSMAMYCSTYSACISEPK